MRRSGTLERHAEKLTRSEIKFISHCLDSQLQKATDNIEDFCIHHLPTYFTEESADFHRETFMDLAFALHQDTKVLLDQAIRNLAYAYPREHGKTTTLDIGALLYIIYNWKDLPYFQDRPPFIVIACNTARQARRRVEDLAKIIEGSKTLRRQYGNKVGSRNWTKNFFVTSDGVVVLGVGQGGALRGELFEDRRPSLIVVDDLESDRHVRSEDQREQVRNWFFKTLLPLGSDALVICLGTVLHRDCLIGRLTNPKRDALGAYEYYPEFMRRRYAAELTDSDGERRSLWPQKFPIKKLDRIKATIGSIAYNSEYMNDPVDEGSAVFKWAWLVACQDVKRSFLSGPPPKDKYLAVFQAWDLAIIDDKKKAERGDTDYTVGITIGVTPEFTWDILRMVRVRGIQYNQVLDLIEEEAATVWPRGQEDFFVAVEVNAFGHLIEWGLEQRPILKGRVIPHITTYKKTSHFSGVPALAVMFEKGAVSIPFKGRSARASMTKLMEELNGIPHESHDDTVMALYVFSTAYRRWINTRIEIIRRKGFDADIPSSLRSMMDESGEAHINIQRAVPEQRPWEREKREAA